MESSLLQTKCSGCGKVEKETTFKACPTCIELKMLPSVYCCEECFRVDWKTHKKKHDEFADRKSEVLIQNYDKDPAIKEIGSKKYRKDLKRMSEDVQMSYFHTYSLISSAMAAMDYNRAENLCKKAMKEFPSYPEPYDEMANILINQNELNDAMRFMEVCIEKACRLSFTTEKTKSNEKRSGIDESFISMYSLNHKLFVVRVNLIFDKLKQNVEAIQDGKSSSIFTADWIVNDKKFLSLWSYYFEITKDKDSFDGNVLPGDLKLVDPESVTSLVEARKNHTHQKVYPNLSSSPFFDGEWVIAHHLKSSIGKNLNHRVAMVKGDDLHEEGRVAVVFKESGPIKYLKVENLKRARTVNAKAALLMFLDESEQWEFMMNDFLTK